LRTTLALLKDKGAIEVVARAATQEHRIPTRPGAIHSDVTEITREEKALPKSSGPANLPTQIQEYDLHNQATYIHSQSEASLADESLDVSIEVAAEVSAPGNIPAQVTGISQPIPPLPPLEKSAEGKPVLEPVSLEMKRKAERIFEQAQKDHAAGKISSALMNARLATVYHPGHDAYAEAISAWQAQAANQPRPLQREPREVQLLKTAQQSEARGHFEEALRLMDEAIAINGMAAPLHNARGVLLATRLKRFNDASLSIMRAIELDPHNLVYKNNLGKVVAREEDADAEARLKKLAKDRQPVRIKTIRPKWH
jgi:tetratricopeptide (TPR) repeat protein